MPAEDEASSPAGSAPDPSSGRRESALAASGTEGIWRVLPSTTWASGDTPFAAASARVVKPFAAAIDHSVSPGMTVCGMLAAADADRSAKAGTTSRARHKRRNFDLPCRRTLGAAT